MAETGPGGGSEVGYIQRLPDFRSMLEAALRGDAVRCYLTSWLCRLLRCAPGQGL